MHWWAGKVCFRVFLSPPYMNAIICVFICSNCALTTLTFPKCVCPSCQVHVKCRRADRSVYKGHPGVTSKAAGSRDWLPAFSSLCCLHRDIVPEDTVSICFTTNVHSHTHLSERHRKDGRQPIEHLDPCVHMLKHDEFRKGKVSSLSLMVLPEEPLCDR